MPVRQAQDDPERSRMGQGPESLDSARDPELVEWACRGAGARSYRSLIARTGHPSSVAECALDQLNLSRRLHGRIGFPEQGPRFRLLSGARQGKPVGKGQSG